MTQTLRRWYYQANFIWNPLFDFNLKSDDRTRYQLQAFCPSEDSQKVYDELVAEFDRKWRWLYIAGALHTVIARPVGAILGAIHGTEKKNAVSGVKWGFAGLLFPTITSLVIAQRENVFGGRRR